MRANPWNCPAQQNRYKDQEVSRSMVMVIPTRYQPILTRHCLQATSIQLASKLIEIGKSPAAQVQNQTIKKKAPGSHRNPGIQIIPEYSVWYPAVSSSSAYRQVSESFALPGQQSKRSRTPRAVARYSSLRCRSLTADPQCHRIETAGHHGDRHCKRQGIIID